MRSTGLGVVGLLVAMAGPPLGCGDGGGDGEGLLRLHAEGTRIVDAAGREVRLRGVNLGGWLFHETWITLVGYDWPARIHHEAQKCDLAAEVVAAMRQAEVLESGFATCVSDSQQWLDAFEAALRERVDAQTADDFMAQLAQFESTCDDSELPLRLRLEQRFGTDGRDALLDTFLGAWIREADIAWLAAQGFNVVRVPMGYRSLTSGSDLSDIQQLDLNERALERLDDLIDWCAAHGVYAVIDIQEAPGGQNTYAGEARLYTEPRFQQLTIELWQALSDRYRERDAVAAYSLLAEPYGAPSAAARDEMYDRLVQAIRARGDDHLLVIHDGFRSMSSLPDPAEYGWQQVIYSTHLFESGPDTVDEYRELIDQIYRPVFAAAQADHDVPYYIGSFSTRYDAPWAHEAAGVMVDWYEAAGYSWSLWTFKKVPDPLFSEVFDYSDAWGLLSRLPDGAAFERPDLQLDSRAELERKLGAYAELELQPVDGLLEQLTRPMQP